jgi:glycosyltransferase involved in cell wall biosynthesis
MPEISVVILTYNEEIHIERVLNNVANWASEVLVYDSFSEDNTISIVSNSFPDVLVKQRRFDNYASQRLASLQECRHEWVLFLDADEYLSEELKEEISQLHLDSTETRGYYLNRRFIFMNQWIRFGGYFPSWNLRLFSKKYVSIEREINEFIQVEGKTERLKALFTDHNLNDFSFWLTKHNKYSSQEALELEKDYDVSLSLDKHENKKWIRQKIWNSSLPPLVRPFLYFLYRYIFKAGFLDGRSGFIYHFFHALVYRLIIDIKFLQNRKKR